MIRRIREAGAIAIEFATEFASKPPVIGAAACHSPLPRHLLQGRSRINATSGRFRWDSEL